MPSSKTHARHAKNVPEAKGAAIVQTVDPAVTVDAAKAVATVDLVEMVEVIADRVGMAAATVAHAPSVVKAEKAAATPTTFRRS